MDWGGLAGRDGLVAEAVSAVGSRGVVLAGPSGSGRSRLLAACAERSSAAIAAGDVIAVDDLHLLPLADAAALRERVASSEVRLLATVLADQPYLEPVARLWRDDGVVRLDIPPLDADAVSQLASACAGGPVEAVAVHRLLELSGGLPRDLLDLLHAATEYGWFDHQHGVVRMRPGLPDTESLRCRIARLDELSAEGRLAVEFVALARSVAMPILATLTTHAAVAEARAGGLLEVGDHARPASPLVGELIRMSLDDATRRRHRAALAERLGAPLDGDGRRLVAESFADTGFTVAGQVEFARGVVAEGLEMGWSDVVDLASAVWQATGAVEDGLALTLAYDHAGRPAEQAAVAAELVAAPGSDHSVAVAADRLASALVRVGRDGEALDVLRSGLDQVRDPAAVARLRIALANRHLHGGDLSAAIAAIEPVLALGVPVPEAALVAAVAYAASGQSTRAIELADLGEDMLADGDGAEVGELAGQLLAVARALAHTEAGRLDDAEASVSASYTQSVAAGARPRQGWTALALGRIELARGRARRALRYFGDATIGFGDIGEIGYVAWALAGRAAALALLGNVDAARGELARREALPHRRLGLFEPESQRLLAMVEWIAGDHDGATRRLRAAISAAGDQVVAGAACAHDLVRLGVHDALEAFPDTVGERVAMLADHAHALAAGDGQGLLAAASTFAQAGAWLDAGLAFAEAAERLTDERDRALARRRARAMVSRCEGVAVPALDAVPPVSLTARQLDVATLAAAGLSRLAIAAQLFLSDRTVDRHLSGAFAALGVRAQDQLHEALDDLRVLGLAAAEPATAGPSLDRWPLVGRTDEADAVRRAVADPGVRGVILRGPVGSGKTRLAAELQSELTERGWTGVTIRGTAPHETAMEALASALRGRSVALVIDDAGFLDDEAVAAIRTALGSLDGFAVITASGDRMPAPLDRPDVLTIAIRPLGTGAVREILASALKGPVLGTTSAAFERASAGNALLLRELLRGALATERLVQRDGVWGLNGPLVPSPPLRDLVRDHLGSLGADARRTLDLLAVTRSLPRPLAETLITADELRLAIDSGLIECDAGGVQLTHESYAAEILAQLDSHARAAILDSVLDAADASGMAIDPARRAAWSLQAGRTPAPRVLVDAAAQALWLSDPATALTFAGQAAASDPAGSGPLVAALAESMLGRFDDADARLAAIGGAPAALIRSDIALWLGNDLERAAAVLGSNGGSQPELIEMLAHRRVPSDADATDDPRRLLVRSMVASMAGRHDAAGEAAGRAAELLGQDWQTWHLFHAVVFNWVRSLLLAGRLDDATAVLEARRRGPLVHPGPEEGLVDLERGHLTSATLSLRDALAHPIARPGTPMWIVAHGGLALAAAWSGDAATARTELQLAGRVPTSDRRRVEAWALAAEGDRPGAAAMAGADAARLAGRAPGIAIVLAHDAVRLGDLGRARLLGELAAQAEGPLATARARFAAAVAVRDPTAMLAAAEQFAACGTDLLAAEAGATAAAWWRDRGDRRSAKHAAAAAHGWQSLCGGAATPALQSGAADLTPRQLDIARLAASGLSSRDIADRLGLSIRTVDNQLQRVYERLGIRGRSDLAAALR